MFTYKIFLMLLQWLHKISSVLEILNTRLFNIILKMSVFVNLKVIPSLSCKL
jgi:hypothetical protein